MDKTSRQESAKKSYLKVVDRFENINKDDIEVVYAPEFVSLGGLMILEYEVINNKLTPKIVDDKMNLNPTLMIGEYFFNLPHNEREAIIAHELGHYHHFNKNPTLERAIKMDARERAYKYLTIMEQYNPDEITSHLSKQLKKWHTLHEVYADNQAAKAGYAIPSLNLIRNIYEHNKELLADTPKKEQEARIANLEKIIKEQK